MHTPELLVITHREEWTMNPRLHPTRLLLSACALALVLSPTRGRAAEAGIQPLPPDGTYYGLKMVDWAVAWLEWVQNIPQSSSPDMAFDKTGLRGGVGQHGPVWFTPGHFNGSGTVTRSYTIPAGKAILLLVDAGEGHDVPGKLTDAQLVAAAETDYGGGNPNVRVSLDGVEVPDPNRYLVTTPVFTNVLPVGSIFGVSVSAGKDPRIAAAGKGIWMLFPPLPVGKHVFHIDRPDNPSDRTFNVTIANPNEPLP
jgi:hypothetical protein